MGIYEIWYPRQGRYFLNVCVKLKDRKRSLSGKTTTMRCGIIETATTRNFLLWLFLKNHDAG